jgi:hypothetical protein
MQSKTTTAEERKQRVAERAGQALEQIQQAALQAAFDAAEKGEVPSLADALAVADREVSKHGGKTQEGVGSGAPGPGRPRGVRNKLTDLRAAVLEAFDRVGGAEYLVRLAEGTQSDRAAFVSLMNKVLPTQINQQVEGGVRLELSWLGGRNIGTTTAQIPEQRTQVLDLERDSDGGYRIKDPNTPPGGAAEGVPPAGDGQAGGGDLGQQGLGGAQGGGT